MDELDCDQSGTVSAEYVDIYNASALPVALDGLALEFINSANHQKPGRMLLTGTFTPGAYAAGGSSMATSAVPPERRSSARVPARTRS